MSAGAGRRGAGAEAYARSRLPAGGTRWRAARYCAVDLELTGLDRRRDEIISFAAIPIDNGRARPGDAVEGLARPTRPIDEASIRVHGLRAADLEHAPEIDQAIEPLLAAMAGRIPVVHVAEIERSFLRPVLRRRSVRLRPDMVDTSVLGAIWLNERDRAAPRRMTLAQLAAALGLPSHRAHDAAADALTTAQVFLALAAHLDQLRPQTVRTLSTARRRLHAIVTYP